MHFRAESPSTSTKSLRPLSPFLCGAPAAQGCARTVVLSIIAPYPAHQRNAGASSPISPARSIWKAPVHAVPLAVFCRKHPPRRSRPANPQNGFYESALLLRLDIDASPLFQEIEYGHCSGVSLTADYTFRHMDAPRTDRNSRLPHGHIAPTKENVKLGDIDSWARYISRYGTADYTFATWTRLGLTGILDYHTAGDPGRASWHASAIPRISSDGKSL